MYIAAAVVVKENAPPITEDVVHDRFLACVEKEDANGALAHFAFIACEGGASLTLRRRQLLVLLCEKGMIKEASELLTNAVASPAFDAQDVSTIVRFGSLWEVCCVSHEALLPPIYHTCIDVAALSCERVQCNNLLCFRFCARGCKRRDSAAGRCRRPTSY